MKAVGIVVEYNPFHNGHLYHLNKTKELYPDHVIICVMSAHFTQRGHPAIINKWARTEIALNLGVDIVLELPYVFTCEHANLFAKGSIRTLANLNIEKIVFGSESNNINSLKRLANIQANDDNYQKIVKKLIDEGLNYATACSKALEIVEGSEVNVPNDILGLAYIKEIIESKFDIEAISIQRTNDYHSEELEDQIASATAVRKGLLEKSDVFEFVPKITYQKLLDNPLHYSEDYYNLLKYKVITSTTEELQNIHLVDEGLEYRIKKAIDNSSNFDEFIKGVKSKRYTYSRINRMLTHVLVNYKKSERAKVDDIEYSRVLGANALGRKYLRYIKDKTTHPIINKQSDLDSLHLDIEQRVSQVYNHTSNEDLDQLEYKNFAIFTE